MKRFLRITLEIFLDVIQAIVYFIINNLRNIAWLIDLLVPYVMYFVAYRAYDARGEFAIGGELFIPVVMCIVTYFIRSLANKIGKGYSIPVPRERFTEVDDDGEVSVRHDRLQEMLLYMADLEDWLERKGIS